MNSNAFMKKPILVTGAAGRLYSVGRRIESEKYIGYFEDSDLPPNFDIG